MFHSAFAGGAGGGVITITALSTFSANGVISTVGNVGYRGSGGGSGGSILIQATNFTGTGSIIANGGPGNTYYSGIGGGGSGGRIAIHYYFNTFTGSILCAGGAGSYAPGGPGTIFMHDYTQGLKTLTINNAGNAIDTPVISSMANTLGTIAWLTEPNIISFQFDVVVLKGSAGFAISPTGSLAVANPNVSHIYSHSTNA